MPNPSLDALHAGARPVAGARALGPYEAAYDVRRGYDEPAPRPARDPAPEPVWIGRRRDPRPEGVC